MWFLLGFISIGLCIIFEFWRRHLAKWKPEGNIYGLEYRHVSYKSKIKQLYLGINCTDAINFSIKHQSWLDRLFKFIGVSNEFETSDPEFDDSFYLVTDNRALQHLIMSSAVFRSAIKNIMKSGRIKELKPKNIYCRNGRLWCVFSVGGNYEKGNIDRISHSLHKYFNEAALVLSNSVRTKTSWRDPFVIKAAIFLAISSGFAINGIVQLFRSFFGYFPFVLNNSQIFLDALKYSAIAMVLLLIAALFSLRRSARTHIVLLELVVVGSLGIYLSTAMEMRDINMEWDGSPPHMYTVDIVDKYESKSSGRRKRTHYYVIVKDWRCNCGNYRLSVSRATYSSINGDRLSIVQRQGYLGYPWISQIIPNPREW